MREIPKSLGHNAALALARYVPWNEDGAKDTDARASFFGKVAGIAAMNVYCLAFDRWKKTMTDHGALCVTATLGGPLAVGLGNESAYETGLTLHHVYGMPFIPGSALKGTCLRAVREQETDVRTQAERALFGSPDGSGCAIFHDAWFDPSPIAFKPLGVDTVTVHHPNYYRTKGKDNTFPTDFDDPNPVPFVSVRPGAKFFFAIEIPGAGTNWMNFAEAMLKHTLTESGLGGKTNAGYGWFQNDAEVYRPKSPEEMLEPYRARILALTPQNLSQAEAMLANADSAELKSLLAAELKQHIDVKMRRWNNADGKSWRKAIEEALRETVKS